MLVINNTLLSNRTLHLVCILCKSAVTHYHVQCMINARQLACILPQSLPISTTYYNYQFALTYDITYSQLLNVSASGIDCVSASGSDYVTASGNGYVSVSGIGYVSA